MSLLSHSHLEGYRLPGGCFVISCSLRPDLDFDFVVCKTPKEAKRLYDALEKYAGSNEYVFFTGTLNRQQSSMMLNKLEEKTGWSRINCKRTTSI